MVPLRSWRRVARALAACVALPLLASCVGQDTTPMSTRYREAVRQVMDRYHTPGALASVRFPGDGEWKETFGYAYLATKTPVDPGAHFPIRSITKSFTVTLILQLVRDGALSLDDKLDKYIPGIPNGSKVSIADLAGMQSGIANYTAVPAFQQYFVEHLTDPYTDAQLLAFAIPASPQFEPGAQYDYSNTNTILLGMIVEKLAGQPLGQVLKTKLFDPLALTGTSYPTGTALPLPAATPYDVDVRTGAAEVLPLVNLTSLSGAGAMVSTLDDLQTWGQALGDGRLIGAALQIERLKRSRPATDGPEYDRYGLGIGQLDGWWGHTGSALGFQAATFYDPVTRATIAVMVNETPSGDRQELNIAQEIFAALAKVVGER